MPTDANPHSVQRQPSDTAMSTTTLRALAAHDERDEVRGPDTLAKLFLTEDRRELVDNPSTRRWVLAERTAPGMYEFIIARTAFFDHVVRDALARDLPQIVFLGAGYDTRPYRFRELIRGTRIFELDAPPTQRRKREILEQAGIAMPDHLAFVPIDFSRDNLADRLLGAGFVGGQQALFVCEGVTYYLTSAAVDDVLAGVRTVSAPGSSICFDYAELSPEALNEEGVRSLRGLMKSEHAGEPTRFGIPYGTIRDFLAGRRYEIIERLGPSDMEMRYLTLRDGSVVGRVPALFSLVHAASLG